MGDREILTVGHSDHPVDRFVELLHQHGITAVADVRSMPYSRFNPQYNREDISASLKLAGIGYVFLGKELGARRDEPGCYVDGKAKYELIAEMPLFHEGLGRLQQGSERYRIALMCAEKDPLTCHRTILVGRHLRGLGFRIAHILDNGKLETNETLERRLLKVVRIEGGDLFSSESEAIQHAYEIQGDRIAYTRSKPEGE